jgi:chromosome segregation ATPase
MNSKEGASLASKVDKTLSMLKRFKEHKAKLEKDEAELRKKGKELDEKAERIREHDAHNAAKARELEDREIKMQKIEESYEARIRSMEKEIMALKLVSHYRASNLMTRQLTPRSLVSEHGSATASLRDQRRMPPPQPTKRSTISRARSRILRRYRSEARLPLWSRRRSQRGWLP